MEHEGGTEEDRQIERCFGEIATIEAELLAGNSDAVGLLLGLADWHVELRILQGEDWHAEGSPETRKTGGEIVAA